MYATRSITGGSRSRLARSTDGVELAALLRRYLRDSDGFWIVYRLFGRSQLVTADVVGLVGRRCVVSPWRYPNTIAAVDHWQWQVLDLAQVATLHFYE